jgi:formiminotetrahydrofolate cyclodeaminase
MAAYRLPKGSAEENALRVAAVEEGLKEAAQVPLAVARTAREVLELAAAAVAEGNPNTVTDGAVGALMARSAALGALLNVKINLSAIGDVDFVGAMAAEVRCIEADIVKREAEILAMVSL